MFLSTLLMWVQYSLFLLLCVGLHQLLRETSGSSAAKYCIHGQIVYRFVRLSAFLLKVTAEYGLMRANQIVVGHKTNNELIDAKKLCTVKRSCRVAWEVSVGSSLRTTRFPLHTLVIWAIDDVRISIITAFNNHTKRISVNFFWSVLKYVM